MEKPIELSNSDKFPTKHTLMRLELERLDKAFNAAEEGHNPSSLKAVKEILQQADDILSQHFFSGAPAEKLVRQRAEFMDRLVCKCWEFHGLHRHAGLALAAVGGYGRGELHPGSDIDIAILVKNRGNAKLKDRLGRFLTFLFDLKLDVGQSVRTLDECVSEAQADITIATNLMEARFLTGNEELFHRMREVTGPESVWPTPAFFEVKLKEQRQRHAKFNHTIEALEPHVKEGPGGLRDIQMIGWVAKRHFGADTLNELVTHKFLTEDEYQTLNTGQEFLWRVRMALHLIAERREDRLLFEHQRVVARECGFTDDNDARSGIETFMKFYYRTAMELSRLNEMLLELFHEAILDADNRDQVTLLDRRFQTRNDYIEVRDKDVFKHHPLALLEIFLLMQQHPEIQGVRASTIRLIRDHLYLIDDVFRDDIGARSLFMEIIRQPRLVGHKLQCMHRHGVLAAYLPVFEAITGLMQFDLYHVYTVDAHTLNVLRNMRRYTTIGPEDELRLCGEIMQQIPKPELLYLAGLFHDIAKGRGVDHSEVGAEEAAAFCLRHGLGKFDSSLVSWLVRRHLLMSMTSQRKDISDPRVINEFAQIMGDKMHLDYLYLLTVADIRGTNPSLWNSWRASLLSELYKNTLRALRRGAENPIEKQERIAEVQGEALASLCHTDLSKDAIVTLWESLGEDYFMRFYPDEIAWQTQSILGDRNEPLPLVLVREETSRGGTEIFVYSEAKDPVFAATTQVLDQMGLTILDARIITTKDNYSLSTFNVIETSSNQMIADRQRADQVIAAIKEKIKTPGDDLGTVHRRTSRRLDNFDLPIQVSFSDDARNHRTIMELTSRDRPGLLSKIGIAMQFCGARLQNARVATFGERVEDIFYITDKDGQPISDPVKFECLRNSILELLSE